jgi:hypothetical protein
VLRTRSYATSARATAIAAALLIAFVAKEVDPTMNLSTARAYSEPKRRWRECYLRQHDWRACDAETGFPIDFSADVGAKLELLRKHRLNVYRDGQ